MVTSVLQIYPHTRSKKEVTDLLEKDFSNSALQETFFKICQDITRGDTTGHVQNYKWVKNLYPPEGENENRPPSQRYWVTNSEEGKRFVVLHGSADQQGVGKETAINKIATIMERKLQASMNVPFAVQIRNERTECFEDIKVGFGDNTSLPFTAKLWEVLKKAGNLHPKLEDGEVRIFKVQMQSEDVNKKEYCTYSLDDAKQVGIQSVFNSTGITTRMMYVLSDTKKVNSSINEGVILED